MASGDDKSSTELSLGERAAAGRIEESLFGHSQPTMLGRYQVIEVIGRGAFGSVYRARDTQLERDVALKVLTDKNADQASRHRLIREAKVMATVSHPNVAAIYDAQEVDDHGSSRVFIAMELVTGTSLREWLETKRDRREVLAVVMQAGRGLKAAHEAGVVHRDFKPENILVGDDQRARVVDFGLANASGDDSDAGLVVGTPAYMSPEQLRGDDVDELSDVFAFSVVAWEALYGARPYLGTSSRELEESIREQRFEQPSERVPSIHRVLERGLAADPIDRYGSMDAILAALDVRPPRWRLLAAVAALAALLIVSGAIIGAKSGSSDDPCSRAGETISRAWSPAQGDALRTAFAGVDRAHADETAKRVIERLDGYAAAMLRTYQNACEATHVRKERSVELLDRASECLDRRQADLAAVAEALVVADASVVDRATRAVSELPSLSRCSDLEQLKAQAPLPAASDRDRVAALFERLSKVRALHVVGRASEAAAIVRSIERDSSDIEYAPLLAAMAIWATEIAIAQGDYQEAARTGQQAFDRALAGRDDDSAAAATGLLAFLGAFDPAGREQALKWVETGTSILERRSFDPTLTARLANAEGNIYLSAEDPTRAIPAFQRAIEALRLRSINDPNVGSSLAMLGVAQLQLGRAVAARDQLEAAFERVASDLGLQHPEMASTRVNLSLALLALGDYTRAAKELDAAYASQQQVLGAEHPFFAYTLLHRAQASRRLGRIDAARQDIDAAAVIVRARFGNRHPLAAEVLIESAEILMLRENSDAAVAEATRAVELLTEILGEDSPALVPALTTLSSAHRRANDATAALESADRGLAIARSRLGQNHPKVGVLEIARGAALARTGRLKEGTETFRRGEEILAASDMLRDELADGRFLFAGLLAGDDPSAAAWLARQAVNVLPADVSGERRESFEALARRLTEAKEPRDTP